MSESFNLKIKVSGAGQVTCDLIARLGEALNAEKYDDLRLIIADAYDIATKHYAGDSLTALCIPESEYAPMKISFLDAVCGALEDARASLYITGSKKNPTIELNGVDNGTGDAAAFLLMLLDGLPLEGLQAKGKGYTWLAQWLRDQHGDFRLQSYEPLQEGQKIDPKADQKLQRRVQKENAIFLASPLRGLVDNLPADPSADLLKTIDKDHVLGFSYSELIGAINGLPDRTGLEYKVGVREKVLSTKDLENQLTMRTWNIKGQEQTLEIELRIALAIKPAIEYMASLKLPLFDNIQEDEFVWESNGLNVEVKMGSWMLCLIVTRNLFLRKIPLSDRLKTYVQVGGIPALCWLQLCEDLYQAAQEGNEDCLNDLKYVINHPRCGVLKKLPASI